MIANPPPPTFCPTIGSEELIPWTLAEGRRVQEVDRHRTAGTLTVPSFEQDDIDERRRALTQCMCNVTEKFDGIRTIRRCRSSSMGLVMRQYGMQICYQHAVKLGYLPPPQRQQPSNEL